MTWALAFAVAALVGWGLSLRLALRAQETARDAIQRARDALDGWAEVEAARGVYADAFLSVVSSLHDESASDEQRSAAVQRAIDSVHDYVAVQQEHRED